MDNMDNGTKEVMIDAARLLDEHFNGGDTGEHRVTGFILIAFPFGSDNRDANYIANGGDRWATIGVLETLVRRLKV
jgi:hypothetical protein